MPTKKTCNVAVCVLCLALAAPLPAHQPHDPVLVLGVSPNFLQDQTVFLTTDYLSVSIGVYLPLKSTDGGVTWTPMQGLPNLPASAIEVSPAYRQDGIAFLAGQGGVYRTTNRGVSWSMAGAEFADGARDVAASPAFGTDKTVFALDAGGALYRSTNRGNTWTRLTPGPPVSTFQILAVSPNFPSDRMLLAGTTSDGIYRSTDGGSTWSSVTQGMTLPAISVLAFSPAFLSDQKVFAGTAGAGVLVSADGGLTWEASNNGLTDLTVTAVVPSPGFATSAIVLAATAGAGVFKSADGGASWTPTAQPTRELSDQTETHYRALAVARRSSGLVWFLGMFEGFWKSTNGAGSWQFVDILPTNLAREMRVSPDYPQDQTLIVSTYGGGSLWSTTGGQSWLFQNTGLSNAYPDSASFSSNYAADGIAFHGIVRGLRRSTNRGANWQPMQMLGVPAFPRALGVSPAFAQDHTLFIGIDNLASGNPPTLTYNGNTIPNQGVFISTDAGYTWVPSGLLGPRINSIAVSPAFASDRTVFAASPVSGLYKSTDAGLTFAPITIVPTDTSILQVAVSPAFATDRTVFASTSHSAVWKSTDGGTNWSKLPGTDLVNALDFGISPNYDTDGTLFIGTFQAGLLKSTDGGNSFQTTSLPDDFITAVDLSPGYAQDQTVFAAGYRGIYKSTDGGTTWSFTGEPARQEEDREGSIAYSGAWSFVKDSTSSTMNVATASQAGTKVAISFVGSGVRWIGPRGPLLGSAAVVLDGVVDGNVALTTAIPEAQQVLWEKTGLPCGLHKVVIVAVTPSVSFDALDALRDGCPY